MVFSVRGPPHCLLSQQHITRRRAVTIAACAHTWAVNVHAASVAKGAIPRSSGLRCLLRMAPRAFLQFYCSDFPISRMSIVSFSEQQAGGHTRQFSILFAVFHSMSAIFKDVNCFTQWADSLLSVSLTAAYRASACGDHCSKCARRVAAHVHAASAATGAIPAVVG